MAWAKGLKHVGDIACRGGSQIVINRLSEFNIVECT